MRPLLEGDDSVARDSIYAEYAAPGRNNWAIVRTEDWFYANNTFGGGVLFDLQEDPNELNNIAEDPGSTTALSEMRELALERSLDARPDTSLDARY